MPVLRARLQQLADFIPYAAEALGRDVIGETRGQERRVVIAKVAAEPSQAAHDARHDGKRQQEQRVPVGMRPDDDRRRDIGALPDMPLPGGQPVEGLKDGAVGRPLELPPSLFDDAEVVMDREGRSGTRRRPAGVLRAGRRRMTVDPAVVQDRV